MRMTESTFGKKSSSHKTEAKLGRELKDPTVAVWLQGNWNTELVHYRQITFALMEVLDGIILTRIHFL